MAMEKLMPKPELITRFFGIVAVIAGLILVTKLALFDWPWIVNSSAQSF